MARETTLAEDRSSNCNFSILEKRITRSQSIKRNKIEGWSSSTERIEGLGDSFVSIGVSNRLDEIGVTCGFHEVKRCGFDEVKRKAKRQRKVTKRENETGKP
ncbi:hypothetical protein L2E82_30671 [Cichorium intybus]|uniref:Uncharacterized protein n=1 Tax=Cichorium intybus TaxID=13427 RepID=A0ACB9D1H7_CICIN|nr:hypothetical protein L2E82_30671 [Cichorium intybus]